MGQIALMPTMGTLVQKGEVQTSKDNKVYSKVCIALNDQYIWCALFSGTANYIDSYAKVGAQIFLEDWHFTKNDKYYDFVISKCRIVKNSGGDK